MKQVTRASSKELLTTEGVSDGCVFVRGAREHNLKNIDVKIPRDALVVFTGISGSGKSSLAFGTLYAEAQRRYLESVSPYARRLFHQMSVPEVDAIDGLPPAVALQQQRGAPTTRSSVGSVTTLSNLMRMLYSRAGTYPPKQPLLEAEAFSANTPAGACPKCHGLGRIYTVTEQSMVPDDRLTIRERAVAAWPPAWHGQNLRDMLVTLGIDIDKPWRELPKKTRDWILFTDDQPVVPVFAGFERDQVKRALKAKMEPSYHGNFSSAKRHVLYNFANTQSPLMKKRVMRYMISAACAECGGKRLKRESLSVKFEKLDFAEISALPLKELAELVAKYSNGTASGLAQMEKQHPEKVLVTKRIAQDLNERLAVLLKLGLGYLSLERSTPTLSVGELQRLRLATQVRSNLFGVVYVLDEPSAGLHPNDTEALISCLNDLKQSGNSLFVVEHELDIIRCADWVVDVGPAAGENGGQILYSGPLLGLSAVKNSHTQKYLFGKQEATAKKPRSAKAWLTLEGISCNNLKNVKVDFPLGTLTAVTGISGSGKTSLVTQALSELVLSSLGHAVSGDEEDGEELERIEKTALEGRIVSGMESIKRLVKVDQKPIGRTPRSNLATYTGLFDQVRKIFSLTKMARAKKYDAGRFSFNVAKGRCETCQGEGSVMVELLFLPSVYAPCPSCHGARYNEKTLEITYLGRNIAEVLQMTVDQAFAFFADEPSLVRSFTALREVGLGYLRLGQPATELSGGEAQRIKLAAELQRINRGDTLYVLDEPTTGLHPSDVEKLVAQLDGLVDAGNTVIVVEHEMQMLLKSDWIIDIGPGAGDEGGRIVASGTPFKVAKAAGSRTAPYLERYLTGS